MFGDFLNNVATVLGTTDELAGIFISLLITVTLMLVVEIASRGKGYAINGLIVAVVSIMLFTGMEWLPAWTGGALALGFSLIGAMIMSRTGA